jgi:hypothetical protein
MINIKYGIVKTIKIWKICMASVWYDGITQIVIEETLSNRGNPVGLKLITKIDQILEFIKFNITLNYMKKIEENSPINQNFDFMSSIIENSWIVL